MHDWHRALYRTFHLPQLMQTAFGGCVAIATTYCEEVANSLPKNPEHLVAWLACNRLFSDDWSFQTVISVVYNDGMSDQLYFTESIIRSHVKRLGWKGVLADCFQYSCRYLKGVTIWMVFWGAVAVLWALIGSFGGIEGNQQPIPVERLWAGLLLIPIVLAMGFFVRFFDSRTWAIREGSIDITSVIDSVRFSFDEVRIITIEEYESHEVWRIENDGGSKTHVAAFLKTKHNQLMKARLFESGEFVTIVDLVEQVAQHSS